jgi:VanZ like protein
MLRYRKLWLVMGWGFVCLVIYLSLTADSLPIVGTSGNKPGHFVAYAWLMLWFAQLYRGTRTRYLILAGFCALGIVLECLQGLTDYRSFEYADMALNSFGTAFGLLLAQTPLQRSLAWLEAALQQSLTG